METRWAIKLKSADMYLKCECGCGAEAKFSSFEVAQMEYLKLDPDEKIIYTIEYEGDVVGYDELCTTIMRCPTMEGFNELGNYVQFQMDKLTDVQFFYLLEILMDRKEDLSGCVFEKRAKIEEMIKERYKLKQVKR